MVCSVENRQTLWWRWYWIEYMVHCLFNAIDFELKINGWWRCDSKIETSVTAHRLIGCIFFTFNSICIICRCAFPLTFHDANLHIKSSIERQREREKTKARLFYDFSSRIAFASLAWDLGQSRVSNEKLIAEYPGGMMWNRIGIRRNDFWFDLNYSKPRKKNTPSRISITYSG